MPVRWMSENDAYEFLAAQTEGRLATCNSAGQPYITPVNHLLHKGRLYFHGKPTGRKLDNLTANSQVCYEVSTVEKITVSHDRPCGCSTRYTSVLALGSARLVADEAEKAALLNLLVKRHAGGKAFERVEEQHAANCAVVEIRIAEISGKRNVDPE